MLALVIVPSSVALTGCGANEDKPDLKPGETYAPRPNNNEKAKNAPPRATRGSRGDG